MLFSNKRHSKGAYGGSWGSAAEWKENTLLGSGSEDPQGSPMSPSPRACSIGGAAGRTDLGSNRSPPTFLPRDRPRTNINLWTFPFTSAKWGQDRRPPQKREELGLKDVGGWRGQHLPRVGRPLLPLPCLPDTAPSPPHGRAGRPAAGGLKLGSPGPQVPARKLRHFQETSPNSSPPRSLAQGHVSWVLEQLTHPGLRMLFLRLFRDSGHQACMTSQWKI